MTFKDPITYDDFTKIDFRVVTVTQAALHPNADRLLVLRVDDGTEEGRQLCAGIRDFYEPDDLIGKTIIIVANLESRKIRGEISNGMLCAATDESGGENGKQVILLTVDRPTAPGSTVS